MKRYVYKNLMRFGNCFISEKELNKKGKIKILNDLKRQGFDCSIKVIENKLYSFNNTGLVTDNDVIIVLNKMNKTFKKDNTL